MARLTDFSLDGSVVSVTPAQTDPANLTVTLKVNEHYVPATGPETVQVELPGVSTIDDTPPAVETGVRMLISGTMVENEDGSGLMAWGCGYTRYYNEDEAIRWRTAAAAKP